MRAVGQTMAQDLDKLRARLEGLKELAQHAAPKDRARLYRTIYLNAVAIEALADARQATQRGIQRRKAAEVEEALLRMQEEAVLAELLAANEETGLLEELYLKDIDTSK
jgi:hypothetical protein